VAWGFNGSGQCNVPVDLTNVADVAAGWNHSVAMKKDGTVVCWGDNGLGQTNVPSGLSNVVAIAAGGFDNRAGNTLALQRDGTVVVWGGGQTTLPIGLDHVIAIAAGAKHQLAIRTGPSTPVITQEPLDQYQVAGSNAVFTARGLGLYTVRYQWQVGGVNITWATNTALILTNVSAAQEGLYNVVVSNEVGVVTGSTAGFHLVTPPVINAQIPTPTNQTVLFLTNLLLTVNASAPGMYAGFPLSYQWRFDGTNLANANGSSYAVQVGAHSSGTYSVQVTNAVGSAFANWQLTTYFPSGVGIAQQPADQYQIAGGSVTFTGSGASSNSVAYRWAFNGTNLAGATNAALTLTNVSAAQEGYYNFTVTSPGASVASSNAIFYLVRPPSISARSLPTNIVAIFQTNVTLSALGTSLGNTNGFPLGYQWQFNGTNIARATSTNFTFNAGVNSSGAYSVQITNAAGSTNAFWQVSLTFDGTYIASNTLSYHLSTNTAAHTNGISDIYNYTMLLSGWQYETYYETNLPFLTNAVWSTNFWLRGVQGLCGTCIGISNGLGGQGLATMVSPRHYLCATHMHPESGLIAFLDTNNIIHWRKTMERIDIPKSFTYNTTNDMSVGILDADLPPSVGYLKVLPENYTNYLPTSSSSIVQGIGMNQEMQNFGQTMNFSDKLFVTWDCRNASPFGVSTNWNYILVGGDSSDPEMLLIDKQLILVTHNFNVGNGPNYALQIPLINQFMHYLSTNNAGPEYYLTSISLTNWPTINH